MELSRNKLSLVFILFSLLFHGVISAYNYHEALSKSLLYFEAQRSGKLPAQQRVTWRADSGLKDGLNAGVNLVGGYYDAGDNVKFGFPMAFTVTLLAWGVVEYRSYLKAHNELNNALAAIKWGTDYFIKAHPQPNLLYAGVGDGDSDHQCWERPEDMTTPRTVYKIDEQNPGSDLAAETSAALAAASIAFKHVNAKYSSLLLTHSKQDYNATVEFYWAPFLVESNSDDPNMHSILNRIIMPESIKKHAVHWKNVDYLIFNTYIWWMNTFSMKVLRGSFDEGATEYDEVERPVAYARVLKTWSKWVDKNIDPNRTTVFFMSMSPLHIKSLDWENPDGIKCALETMPIMNMTMPLNVGTDRRLFREAHNVTQSMKRVPVSFLNITTLSEYRKDAHTSVHTIRQGKLLDAEQQADPEHFADCIHWCLPGLPDTWNEFLYTKIISRPT